MVVWTTTIEIKSFLSAFCTHKSFQMRWWSFGPMLKSNLYLSECILHSRIHLRGVGGRSNHDNQIKACALQHSCINTLRVMHSHCFVSSKPLISDACFRNVLSKSLTTSTHSVTCSASCTPKARCSFAVEPFVLDKASAHVFLSPAMLSIQKRKQCVLARKHKIRSNPFRSHSITRRSQRPR